MAHGRPGEHDDPIPPGPGFQKYVATCNVDARCAHTRVEAVAECDLAARFIEENPELLDVEGVGFCGNLWPNVFAFQDFWCTVASNVDPCGFFPDGQLFGELEPEPPEPQPDPPTFAQPCTTLASDFVATDPRCMALLDDLLALLPPLLRSGPIGPIGPRGPGGVGGPIGPAGTAGLPGAVGPAGVIGATGALGPIGLPGALGPIGPIGAAGIAGALGLQGLQGLIGLTGPAGTFPTLGTEFATFLRGLAVEVGRLIRRREERPSALPPGVVGPSGAVGAVGAAGATGLPGVTQTITLERVEAGGTISQPVIRGAGEDPRGQLRPVFPRAQVLQPLPPGGPTRLPPGPRPSPARAATLRIAGRLASNLLELFISERQRRSLRDLARRRQRLLESFFNLQRRTVMPFGQMGFNVGQDQGGGGIFSSILASLPDILSQVPGVIGAIRGPGRAPSAVTQFAGSGPGTLSFPGLGLGEPGTVLGEILGGGVPPLFRQTMTRTVPISEFSVIGPTGRCETWLHARPKGWKINKSNVSGRRRHHHHPR